MTTNIPLLLVNDAPFQRDEATPTGDFVQMLGETYYRIRHYDQMPPFFMSLVSSSDHWLFISILVAVVLNGLIFGDRGSLGDPAAFAYV